MRYRSMNFNFEYFPFELSDGSCSTKRVELDRELSVFMREISLLPTESGPGCCVYDDQLRSGERDRFHQAVHESRYRNSV